jgi:hypothetical protein
MEVHSMHGDQFDLYFGPIKGGAVTETGGDPPDVQGMIVYDLALSGAQSADAVRLVKFIALTKESERLAIMKHDPETAEYGVAVNAALEAKYLDIFESDQWRLIDKHGRVLPVLYPIFRKNGEIVWVWSPDEVSPET